MDYRIVNLSSFFYYQNCARTRIFYTTVSFSKKVYSLVLPIVKLISYMVALVCGCQTYEISGYIDKFTKLAVQLFTMLGPIKHTKLGFLYF